MTKLAINRSYGGFSLSEQALSLYRERSGSSVILDRDIRRDDPVLISVIEELQQQNMVMADGMFATIRIVEIPDDVEWIIQEYDGLEVVAEVHRTWGDDLL